MEAETESETVEGRIKVEPVTGSIGAEFANGDLRDFDEEIITELGAQQSQGNVDSGTFTPHGGGKGRYRESMREDFARLGRERILGAG